MDFENFIGKNKNVAAYIFQFVSLFDKLRLAMVNKTLRNVILSKSHMWRSVSLQNIWCFSLPYLNYLMIKNYGVPNEDENEDSIEKKWKECENLENERKKSSILSQINETETKKFLRLLIHLGINKFIKVKCFFFFFSFCLITLIPKKKRASI